MLSPLIKLFRKAIHHRPAVFALAFCDLKNRYAGSAGGMLWALAHPIALITIYYFVFTVGFRAQTQGTAPFILWFICGLVPWFFVNETLLGITSSLTSNAHFIRKTIFPSEIIPFVYLTSGLLSHFIFLFIFAGVLYFFEVGFFTGRLAIIYFIICNIALIFGFGLMFSALQVFYSDISQGLTVTLNLLFWATPIVWSPEIVPIEYHNLILYNPVYYIVQGYRGVLIYETIFLPSASATICFWFITGLSLFLGGIIFNRLKSEFSDII